MSGFGAIAPPARSNLWTADQVSAAAEVLAKHGRVGWQEPYESEGKARGAGSALARLLADRTGDNYRVSVFERADDPDADPPVAGGFYFSLKPKDPKDNDGDGFEKVNPESHNKTDLQELYRTETGEAPDDALSKRQLADAINGHREAAVVGNQPDAA